MLYDLFFLWAPPKPGTLANPFPIAELPDWKESGLPSASEKRVICPLSPILEGSRLLPWCSPPLQHEDAPSTKLQGEVLAVEEERAQVLGRVEQLKVRVKELEQQLQEAAREVT